jgi:predicted nucleic acid-binding protein
MNVVSNSSPLISLAALGQLSLLPKLYHEITIPDAVWYEVVIRGKGQKGAEEVQTASWIHKQPVVNHLLSHTLQRDLNAGEAEAIVLALETNADILIMDERLGRETATYLGLHCTGVMGILIAAKRQGHIQAVKPLLDTLRQVIHFRVSDKLYHTVLQTVDEM